MSRRNRSVLVEDGVIHFRNLRDTSTLTSRDISLDAPAAFGESNEGAGLRRVSSIEEISEIARNAAQRTKRISPRS